MAYLGGLTAIMANLPGVSRITGFVAFLGWRFTYWFLQLSMRNRFMLGTDWLRAPIQKMCLRNVETEAPSSSDEISLALDLDPNRHKFSTSIDSHEK